GKENLLPKGFSIERAAHVLAWAQEIREKNLTDVNKADFVLKQIEKLMKHGNREKLLEDLLGESRLLHLQLIESFLPAAIPSVNLFEASFQKYVSGKIGLLKARKEYTEQLKDETKKVFETVPGNYFVEEFSPYIEFWMEGHNDARRYGRPPQAGKFILFGTVQENLARIKALAETGIMLRGKFSTDSENRSSDNCSLIIYAEDENQKAQTGLYAGKTYKEIIKTVLGKEPSWRFNAQTRETRFLRHAVLQQEIPQGAREALREAYPVEVLSELIKHNDMKLTDHQVELLLQLLKEPGKTTNHQTRILEMVLLDIQHVAKAESREELIDSLRAYVDMVYSYAKKGVSEVVDTTKSASENIKALSAYFETFFSQTRTHKLRQKTIIEVATKLLLKKLETKTLRLDILEAEQHQQIASAIAAKLGVPADNAAVRKTADMLTNPAFADAVVLVENEGDTELQDTMGFAGFLENLIVMTGQSEVQMLDVLRIGLFYSYVQELIQSNLSGDMDSLDKAISEADPQFAIKFQEKYGRYSPAEAAAVYYLELFSGKRTELFENGVTQAIETAMRTREVEMGTSLHSLFELDMTLATDIADDTSQPLDILKKAQVEKIKELAKYSKKRQVNTAETKNIESDILEIQRALAQKELDEAGISETDGPLVADKMLFGTAERGSASMELDKNSALSWLMGKSGVSYSVVDGQKDEAAQNLTRRLAHAARTVANTTSLARWNQIKTLAPIGEDYQPVAEGKTIYDTEKPVSLAMVPFMEMLVDLEKAPESPEGKDLWQVSSRAAGLKQSWNNMLGINKQATMPVPVTGNVSLEAARTALLQDMGFSEDEVVFARDIKKPEDAHGKVVLMQFDMQKGMDGLVKNVWNVMHPGTAFSEEQARREMVLMMNEKIRTQWKDDMERNNKKYRIAVGEARKGKDMVQTAMPDVFAMGLILASVEEVYENGKLTSDVKNRLRALFTEFFRDYIGEVTDNEKKQIEALLLEIENDGFFHLPPPGKLLQNSINQLQNERAYIDTAA
ncbi:MAG: hypothetical protein P9M03_09445, partial [Candidatus Theseobacter exili]|nr:hypothetical protein [Candidatus Theseobacter exili]